MTIMQLCEIFRFNIKSYQYQTGAIIAFFWKLQLRWSGSRKCVAFLLDAINFCRYLRLLPSSMTIPILLVEKSSESTFTSATDATFFLSVLSIFLWKRWVLWEDFPLILTAETGLVRPLFSSLMWTCFRQRTESLFILFLDASWSNTLWKALRPSAEFNA